MQVIIFASLITSVRFVHFILSPFYTSPWLSMNYSQIPLLNTRGMLASAAEGSGSHSTRSQTLAALRGEPASRGLLTAAPQTLASHFIQPLPEPTGLGDKMPSTATWPCR